MSVDSEFVEGTSNPIRSDVGYVSTFSLLSRACGQLLWWLGIPGKWLLNFVWLILFVIAMLPAFIPVFLHYLFSSRVVKNIHYGPSIRHQLDVYFPTTEKKDNKKKPVVIFVTGGAWIIGYKTWAFMMGKVFQDNDIIFVAPDYRNFPQAVVGDMVSDVQMSVQWVFEHMDYLGGDSTRVSIVGQSAGAHLSALAIIDAAEREAAGVAGGWRCGAVERWVGISGPYDVVGLGPVLEGRGLHQGILQALMGVQDLSLVSPMQRVGRMSAAAARLLPAATLFHGTADATIPPEQSARFAEQLRRAGANLESMRLYEGKSHTDPILEDPAAGQDPLAEDLLALITGGGGACAGRPALLPRLLPAPLVRLARFVNPF